MNSITSPQLAVRFGTSKKVVAVSSLSEASKVWERLRDEQCLGASESPRVSVVDLSTGKTVAYISYNGRVWDKPYWKDGATEIVVGDYKSAKQQESEGWRDCE